jgi:hypothetical protein
MDLKIYKTNFADEAVGKAALVAAGVWAEVTEEGVTQMVYTNGTKAVVNIGKVVKTPGTYDPDGKEITPPVYYPGWCYDIMSSDTLDFGSSEVYPTAPAHGFLGWPITAEVEPTPPEEEEE